MGTGSLLVHAAATSLAVGERRAREFLLTGRHYSAEAALTMGLVNAVVPDEELESTALACTKELIANDALALRLRPRLP